MVPLLARREGRCQVFLSKTYHQFANCKRAKNTGQGDALGLLGLMPHLPACSTFAPFSLRVAAFLLLLNLGVKRKLSEAAGKNSRPVTGNFKYVRQCISYKLPVLRAYKPKTGCAWRCIAVAAACAPSIPEPAVLRQG
ncbi:unnamed protein product [Effrenium voratum]|nr:unnamed protein product [Effrenium voratum]